MERLKYYLAAIAAFVIWGFFSLVLRPLAAYSSMDILYYRVFVSVIIAILVTVLFRQKVLKQNIKQFRALGNKEKRNFWLLNIGGGILLTGNWFFFIYVMNHISVRATSLAYLVCPILTAVFAFFILKEKLKKQQWLALLLSAAGCVLLSFGHMADMLLSLVIASTYALYLVSQQKNKGFDKLILLAFHISIAAIILLPFYFNKHGVLQADSSFYAYIFVIAALFTIIPLLLNLYALKGISSATVGMLLYINPIIAFLLASIVYHEKITMQQMVAYSLVLLAVFIFNSGRIVNRLKR